MLKKIATSNEPEIWLLLEREFRLIRTWVETGKFDRQQDWNLRKLESQVRRRIEARNVKPAAKVAKRGTRL